ncbi:protein FAR1-RELATED SEQUENCE 5-like [Rhizophagus irregularis DAOM 181602=DAOM 197198]|nr:protein FAR1-RELATED SEQUENCE 5-like [Rhizophagus irregularis DAOM 181602=DAOM 197198]
MIIKIDYVTSTSIFSKTRYRTNPAFARPVPKYDIENPTSNLTLGQTFQTWDEAEKFLNDYALEKGFSIRRKRTENDDNKILRKISWECCCAVIDNCNRTRLVATALLEDETEESFIWALNMIKKSTNDLIPKVVFTDSDPAMANAISLEFPDTIHCLCIFHIDLNLKKNLWNKLKSDEFKAFREEFFHCRNTLISTLFENRWEHLKLKYPSAVKEIQYVLDKESEYARVEEYKDQIPIVGLATIPKAYFKSIKKVVSEFLMPAMVFLVCKQMQECFYYDSFKMNVAIIDSIIQEQINTDYNEGMREENYEVVKVHLTDIISKIGLDQILEIWQLVISCGTKTHYVILLVDGSHHSKWHIGLIASCWYKDDIIDGNNDIWQQSPITLCINSNQEQNNDQYSVYKFDYIKQIRGAEFYNQNLREINCICHGFISDKQAILESGQNMEEINFNIKNPIITTRKGRPAGRAKSCVEIQDQHTRK